LRAVKHELSLAEIVDVANKAHGFVGADLAALCCEGKIYSGLLNK